MGDVDDAVADGEGALAKAESAGLVSARIEALHALGHVRLSLGDAASANVHLARAWEILRRAGFGDPGTFPFVPDHVEALVEIGAVADAEPIVDWLEERGRTLERAYAKATGARCRATAPSRGRRPRRRAHVARRGREVSRALDDAVRAGANAPGPGWRASPRPPETGRPGGARAGARDLRGARCPALGGEEPGRSSPGSEDVEPSSAR